MYPSWDKESSIRSLRKNVPVRRVLCAKSVKQQRTQGVWHRGRHHHQWNAQCSECNNFLNRSRETLQDGLEAVLDPRKEALVSLSLEQLIQEQEIQGYGLPISFENTKERFIQAHGSGWWSTACCSPWQFWEILLEIPERLSQEDQLMDCAVQAVLTRMAKSDDSVVNSINNLCSLTKSKTASHCLPTLLALPHHIDWPCMIQNQLSRTQ